MDGDAMMDEEISAEALGDIKYPHHKHMKRGILILGLRHCKTGFCILLYVVPLLENFALSCLNIPTKSVIPCTVPESTISVNEILNPSKSITVISVTRVP